MIEKIKEHAFEFLVNSSADAVAVAIVDFSNSSYECYQWETDTSEISGDDCDIYFDYASLTKPLINAFNYIAFDVKDHKLSLLVNHRAGIPAWGILQKDNWKEQILNFKIEESPTLYSDYSALRFMLEFEKHTGRKLEDVYKDNLHSKIKFWKELRSERLLQYGFYNNEPNIGRVHDPNASNLNCFTSHAGLFGTVDGLAQTLLDFDQRYHLVDRFQTKSLHRFQHGFDTVENPHDTLAGPGCSDLTFGHVGFTGTSFWIDPLRRIGHVILSNTVKYHWYDKQDLNILRKKVGELVWKSRPVR